MSVGVVRDIATLNRYELRKYRMGRAFDKIQSKARMSVSFGMNPSSLDQMERRYPDFPTPIYKSKMVAGSGWHYYYSTRQVEEFIAKRHAGRVKKYEDIIKRVESREGVSKYGAVLERLGIESEVK